MMFIGLAKPSLYLAPTLRYVRDKYEMFHLISSQTGYLSHILLSQTFH